MREEEQLWDFSPYFPSLKLSESFSRKHPNHDDSSCWQQDFTLSLLKEEKKKSSGKASHENQSEDKVQEIAQHALEEISRLFEDDEDLRDFNQVSVALNSAMLK